jgi:hypothetical protein
MGYTHYWNFKNPTAQAKKQFIDVMMDVEIINQNLPKFSTTAGGHYKDYPIVLRNGLGEDTPEFTQKEICFNGDGSNNLDHETFYFEYTDNPFDFGFCKTARKPYDFVVCCILISLANRVDGFEFSSDGYFEDWEDAFRYYEEHVGKIKPSVKEFLEVRNKIEEGVEQ